MGISPNAGCPMPTNYITLIREELYDMVWATPMTSLAKNFGISDVALAKRCRAVDVPVPPRGYWARKAAGQEPPRTPLPRYRRALVASEGDDIRPRQAARASKEIVRDGPEPTPKFGLPVIPSDPPGTTLALSAVEDAFRQRLATVSF